MCTPGTVAPIFIDGRTLQINRLVGKVKQRTNVPYRTIAKKAYLTNVPYPHHYKKGVPYFLAKIKAYHIYVPYPTELSSIPWLLAHIKLRDLSVYREQQKGNIENFTIFFLFSFFEDSFLLRLLQKISFLGGVVFEIFALELFRLFFCKNVLQKGNV